MKRILAWILLGITLLVGMLFGFGIHTAASYLQPTDEPQAIYMAAEIEMITQHPYVYESFGSKSYLEDAIAKISSYQNYLELRKENLPAEAEDFEYCIVLLNNTISDLQTLTDTYRTEIEMIIAEEEQWAKKAEEYPIATYVWLYMKNNFGWSDVVCAGVMGNIMGEIGRDMKFEKWNHRIPYGMFQWLGGRRQDIHRIYGEEPTIDEQLEFMFDELYGTDGVRQQLSDAKREKILNGKTPESVAQMFCDWFERPGGTGKCRQGYARRAYEYFTS
jgi:hypothetical protein